MSAPKQKAMRQVEDQAPASAPQTTPSNIGYGHPEYQFIQAIMEMQKSLGEISASITALTKTVDSTKSKVEDLVQWKSRILGGAIALGVICTLIGFGVTKFSGYVTFKSPDTSQSTTSQVSQPAAIIPAAETVQAKPSKQK